MKKLLTPAGVIVFLGLVMPTDSLGESPWVSNGPYGGTILCIAIDPQSPQILYAGTDGGDVFKSEQGLIGGGYV